MPAFEHLNLFRNPFGELDADDRARLALIADEPLLRFVETPRAALQVVGDRGFGKTTHLLALRAKRPEFRYTYLPEGRRPRVRTDAPEIMIDEAQRLSRAERRTLFAGPATLILGTHADFTAALRRRGRPVMTVAADRCTDAGTVCTILNRRIDASRRGSGPVPRIPLPTARVLVRLHGSDIRAIEHRLYEVFQNLGSVVDVEV